MRNPEFARRTKLSVSIAGIDVTSYISPDLKDFSFKDNAKGKADEVQLSLTDKDGKWQKEWFIKKGSPVKASLICLDWYRPGENKSLPMGLFTVDEVDLSGPPDIIRVKAVSASKASALSEEARTKGWENYNLEGIAQEIANKNGYSLIYDAPEIPFSRLDQREVSDLAFLNQVAKGYGVNLKVHDGQIILFGAREWDAKDITFTIHKKGKALSPTRYSFKESSQGTSKEAKVTYHDPARRATIEEVAKIEENPPSGQALILRHRAENPSQAIALTKGALRQSNEKEKTGNLEWMGFPMLYAGMNIACLGWGQYDGKYFVESVEHKLGPAYTTSAEIRKTLDY